MTKKQIRRAINIYAAALLYHSAREFPDWLSEKDQELFRAEAETRVHEMLDRVRAPVIPITIEQCLEIARDNRTDR